jgi:WD40 repeat protein
MCGSPDGRWIVAMDDKRSIHVLNAMTRDQDYQLDLKGRPGSVCVCADSRHLLVNMTAAGQAQLIDLYTSTVVQKYKGHTLADEYIVRSTVGGAHESFVLSGSEDGFVYIWHKELGELVEALAGHAKRSNSVAWKPDDPSMFASCGDDGKVKM